MGLYRVSLFDRGLYPALVSLRGTDDEGEAVTTLELARAIADAVSIALRPGGMRPNRHDDSTKDAPTQAVLRTLEAHQSWFCRLSEDERGITVETKYPRQTELFGETDGDLG